METILKRGGLGEEGRRAGGLGITNGYDDAVTEVATSRDHSVADDRALAELVLAVQPNSGNRSEIRPVVVCVIGDCPTSPAQLELATV